MRVSTSLEDLLALPASDGGERTWRRVAIVVVLLVLGGGWGAWFCLGTVTVWERSLSATVKIGDSAHGVQARVAGAVAASELELGRVVHAGEILVSLDVAIQQRELQSLQRVRMALTDQVRAIDDLLELHGRRLEARLQAARAEIREASAAGRAAKAAARLARDEARRSAALFDRGTIAESEADRATAAAARDGALADASTAARARLDAQGTVVFADGELTRGLLIRDRLELALRRQEVDNQILGLELEIERRRIRAPVSGALGRIETLHRGGFVEEGQQVAAIVPDGRHRIVATFAAADTVGRVRPGQAARLRLDAFAWTRYGHLDAVVTRVAAEADEGTVRVELSLSGQGAPPGIALQHGLRGIVDVEVETASPLALLLRSLGSVLVSEGSAVAGKEQAGE